jgi:hypothetical protein
VYGEKVIWFLTVNDTTRIKTLSLLFILLLRQPFLCLIHPLPKIHLYPSLSIPPTSSSSPNAISQYSTGLLISMMPSRPWLLFAFPYLFLCHFSFFFSPQSLPSLASPNLLCLFFIFFFIFFFFHSIFHHLTFLMIYYLLVLNVLHSLRNQQKFLNPKVTSYFPRTGIDTDDRWMK